MKIDSHVHIFSGMVAEKRDLFFDDPGFALLYKEEKARIATAMDAEHYAEVNSLDFIWAMGFCWESGELCDAENQRILREIEGKKTIVPFSSVPSLPVSDIKERIRRAKRDGFKGIGELAFYRQGFGEDQRDYCRAVFEAACEENLPVCFHVTEPVGHCYPGKHGTDLNLIYSLIREFPSLRIMLAHMGGGLLFYELMPEVRKTFSNVVYDTAAVPYLYSSDVYAKSVAITGADRILFGSDFPLLDIRRYESVIRERLSDWAAAAVLGGNAARFISETEV
jgi:predicted TIM-barrel fold metal-dependent hydrolase